MLINDLKKNKNTIKKHDHFGCINCTKIEQIVTRSCCKEKGLREHIQLKSLGLLNGVKKKLSFFAFKMLR